VLGKIIGRHRVSYVALGWILLLRSGVVFMRFCQFFNNYRNNLTRKTGN